MFGSYRNGGQAYGMNKSAFLDEQQYSKTSTGFYRPEIQKPTYPQSRQNDRMDVYLHTKLSKPLEQKFQELKQSIYKSDMHTSFVDSKHNHTNAHNQPMNTHLKIKEQFKYSPDKIRIEHNYDIDKQSKPIVSNAADYLRERDIIMASLMTNEEISRIKQQYHPYRR